MEETRGMEFEKNGLILLVAKFNAAGFSKRRKRSVISQYLRAAEAEIRLQRGNIAAV
jgi:hypothetical protein